MDIKLFYDKKFARKSAYRPLAMACAILGCVLLSFALGLAFLWLKDLPAPGSERYWNYAMPIYIVGITALVCILLFYYPKGSSFVFVLHGGRLYSGYVSNMARFYRVMRRKREYLLNPSYGSLVSVGYIDPKTYGGLRPDFFPSNGDPDYLTLFFVINKRVTDGLLFEQLQTKQKCVSLRQVAGGYELEYTYRYRSEGPGFPQLIAITPSYHGYEELTALLKRSVWG